MIGIPSFKNEDTGNYIYGREENNLLLNMHAAHQEVGTYRGNVLTITGSHFKDGTEIVSVKVTKAIELDEKSEQARRILDVMLKANI